MPTTDNSACGTEPAASGAAANTPVDTECLEKNVLQENELRPPSFFSDEDLEELTSTFECIEGKLDKHPQTAAIILAGGTGERFGKEGGKQLVEIASKSVLTWSAEAFDAVGDVGLIVIVCPEGRAEEYLKRAIDPFPFVTPVVVATSGSTRQESAFSGLELVPEDFEYVILHDGARPLVTPDLIEHTIATLKGNVDCDGAVVAYPAIDTLKVVENGVIVGTPDRSVFWCAQTPQIFRAGIYRRAHAAALEDGFVATDDSALIERLGGRVLVVQGPRDNIKLTMPEDYQVLEAAVIRLYGKDRELCRGWSDEMEALAFDPARLRVGQGMDVHALVPGRKLIIGGVEIPHTLGLLGHSDADVLSHAVADALLGAIRGGDIGKLFPDDDPAFEGADSLVLLSRVADLVRARGYDIIDVDSVIAAQRPKMAPHREAMRENLARAIGVPVENVGVKATTTEHLGFEGREEGISATAVCLLCRRVTSEAPGASETPEGPATPETL